jgi:hypothetical protein
MTICLWNLFHFNSFQQKKKKKEKIKCPKVNTMICVVGAVTKKKKKSRFVCFTHLVGVSMWPMACQISPNHRFQHNPSLKECSNCNPTRPFGSTITCILSHLHQVQEANNKETKRQRERRKEKNTHTPVSMPWNRTNRGEIPQTKGLTIDLNEFVHRHHADWFDSTVSHHHLNPIDPTQPRAKPNLSHAMFLRWYP